MQSDVLSQEEKAELACGCFSTAKTYEVPLPEQSPTNRRTREDWPDWVLLLYNTDSPTDTVRQAVVWMVELGVWTPAEGVKRCLETMAERAGETGISTYSYRWGDAAGDILLAWRRAFDEAARRKAVKTLCRFTQFKVRRLGYRAGVILFGRAFAKEALEDQARPVREAARVWLAKGAVDKPPLGLTGMKPYPRG